VEEEGRSLEEETQNAQLAAACEFHLIGDWFF